MSAPEVNQIIDVREYLGTPGYSMLVVAANTNLSVAAIEDLLLDVAEEHPLVARSRSWIQRRRWLFQQPDTSNFKPTKADQDGRQKQALQIMSLNPKLSACGLSRLLKERGIVRSREWVRKHRCALTTTAPPI